MKLLTGVLFLRTNDNYGVYHCISWIGLWTHRESAENERMNWLTEAELVYVLLCKRVRFSNFRCCNILKRVSK